jgi:hypothetical protein
MSIGQITQIKGITEGATPPFGPRPTPFRIEVLTTGGTEFLEISPPAAAELQEALGQKLRARASAPSGEILALGHHEFIQRVQEIEIESLEGTGPLLRLCTSVEAHPSEPPGPGRHRGATTLAIRMDQSAARRLFQRIHETFQRMDWQLPAEANAKPKSV